MTEQEVRKIVREELIALLNNYQELSNKTVCITDRTGDTCYGYRPQYSEKDVLKILIEELSSEDTND